MARKPVDPASGDFFQGHGFRDPPAEHYTLRLKRYRVDPLGPVVARLPDRLPAWILMDEIERYRMTYGLWKASVSRLLPELHLARRWGQECQSDVKRRRRLFPAQRIIADKFNRINPFLFHDFVGTILYSRMLLDRMVVFARHFLPKSVQPSFTSFADHRQYFADGGLHNGVSDYAAGLIDRSAWFDVALKYVRDKVFVHQGPKMGLLTGFDPRGHYEVVLMLPRDPKSDTPLSDIVSIRVNGDILVEDVYSLVEWYGAYANNKIVGKTGS